MNQFKALLLLFTFIVFNQNTNATTKDSVKVMTYNIWNGFDWGKDLQRKTATINWIKSQNADVVALQELCAYTPEKLKEDANQWGHRYSILLKTKGYSVGITSNKPIVLKERVLKDMWHGMLHCETYGIDFFVVHLSPSDYSSRNREAKIIRNKVARIQNESYILLGDFNAHSPFDEAYLKENDLLLNKYLARDNKPTNTYKNTLNDSFDYSVVSSFLGLPTIDVSTLFIKPKKRFTFPTLSLIKKGRTATEIINFKERIDYILVSPSLAKNCIDVQIYNEGDTHFLSDHFPVVAKFIFNKGNPDIGAIEQKKNKL